MSNPTSLPDDADPSTRTTAGPCLPDHETRCGPAAALLIDAWRSRRGRELLRYKLDALGSDGTLELIRLGADAQPDGAALAERMGAGGNAWRVHAAAGKSDAAIARTIERLRQAASAACASILVAEIPDEADSAPWLAALESAGFEPCARVPDLYADGVDCLIVARKAK